MTKGYNKYESEFEKQTSFVLAHPGMSAWLKNTLQASLEVDPVSILADLEILNLILRQRSEQILRLSNDMTDEGRAK